MPVSIDFMGRLGNCIIEYATARLHAEDNDLELLTPWPWKDWFTTTPCASGVREAGLTPKEAIVYDDHNYEPTYCAPPAHYIFRGYFQDTKWLWPNRDRIRGFFRFPMASFNSEGTIKLDYSRMVTWDQIPKNTQDLGVHCRMTDGATLANLNHIVHPDWYEALLEKEARNYRRVVCINDDPFAWNYYLPFKKRGAIIKSQSPVEDFIELMSFRNLVCGPSTFSYMASLLGWCSKQWRHDPFITIPECKLDWPGAIKIRGGFIDGRCK